jgi:hypothetical protein
MKKGTAASKNIKKEITLHGHNHDHHHVHAHTHDHGHNHDHHHQENECFSFAKELKEKMHDGLVGPKAIDSFFKSYMMDDVKLGVNQCVNAASCTISNAVDASNSANSIVEEVLGKLSKTVSEAVGQNMKIGQDLLKCKDAKDLIGFQKKVFESNFNNTLNFYLDVSYAMQTFASRHVGISADCIDKNIRYFTHSK